MNKADEAALKLAVEVCRQESPGRAEQIDHFLADRPWIEVAEFAAGCCQERALDLPPWQHPPCDITDIEGSLEDNGAGGYRAAAQLLQRMLAVGVSRWHPDPIRACEAAEAKAAS